MGQLRVLDRIAVLRPWHRHDSEYDIQYIYGVAWKWDFVAAGSGKPDLQCGPLHTVLLPDYEMSLQEYSGRVAYLTQGLSAPIEKAKLVRKTVSNLLSIFSFYAPYAKYTIKVYPESTLQANI